MTALTPPASLAHLLTVTGGAWAVHPERLRAVESHATAELRRNPNGASAALAVLGAHGMPDAPAVELTPDGVAIVQVDGILAPRPNQLLVMLGALSTQDLAAQLRALRTDTRVKAVLVVWDSPGGQVLGVPAAAAALRALADDKPTVSLARGTMASAAYWLGSAARAVYIEGATDLLGSIGVYQRLSWQDPEPNTLELVRGKYKRLAVNGKGPTADAVAQAEAQLDYLYTVMVDAVAANRGVSTQVVLDRMADGRLFYGVKAIEAGLADGTATVGDLVRRLATGAEFTTKRRAAPGAGTKRQALPAASAVVPLLGVRRVPAAGPALAARVPVAPRPSHAALLHQGHKRAAELAVRMRAVQAEHQARGVHLTPSAALRLIQHPGR